MTGADSSSNSRIISGRGGKREGAGRKKGKAIKPPSELKKTRSIRMTDAEYPIVLAYLKRLRET